MKLHDNVNVLNPASMIVIVAVDIVHVFAITIVECLVSNEVKIFRSKFHWKRSFSSSGVTCPYLTPPEHGSIRYSNGNKFASRATYECDQGYVLEGVKHRDCQGDQQWGPDDALSYCTKEGNDVD